MENLNKISQEKNNFNLADIILVPLGAKNSDGFYERTRLAKIIKILSNDFFKIRFLNNNFEEYGSEKGVKRNSNDIMKNFGFQTDKKRIKYLVSYFKSYYHLYKKRARHKVN